MTKVPIFVELYERIFHSYEAEANREGVTVESLLEKVVAGLLRELEEDRARAHHPITPR